MAGEESAAALPNQASYILGDARMLKQPPLKSLEFSASLASNHSPEIAACRRR
jgi:hypothetical protein